MVGTGRKRGGPKAESRDKKRKGAKSYRCKRMSEVVKFECRRDGSSENCFSVEVDGLR